MFALIIYCSIMRMGMEPRWRRDYDSDGDDDDDRCGQSFLGFVPKVPVVMHQRFCWRGHSKEFWDHRTRCPHSPVVNMTTTFLLQHPPPPREVIICDKLFVIYDVHIICYRYITDDYRYIVSACLDYWLVSTANRYRCTNMFMLTFTYII